MSRGVVMFGMNNARVDYVQLGIMNLSFIRKNWPSTKVCLITDEASAKDRDLSMFDDVVVREESLARFENRRAYRDTQYYSIDAQFKNETRSSVYDLSPYDETILIDSDYLILSDSLKHCWGSEEEILITKHACDLFHSPLASSEQRLNDYGIPMYWATCVYFRKGEKAKRLFDLIDHIKDNWEFYKLTYEFPSALFRNDYAFSIAIHILSGMVEPSNYVAELPDKCLYTSMDCDQFYGISSPSTIHMFHQDRNETWKYYGVKVDGINVHVMNKLSLINNMKEIMETLHE